MYQAIISRLKFLVKNSAAKGSETAKTIQRLKFAPGADFKAYTELRGKTLASREDARQLRGARKALLNPSTGLERHQLWVTKRERGEQTRALQLAYGFLRGIPYRAMERNIDLNDNFPPTTSIIYHIKIASLWAKTELGLQLPEVKEEDIVAWLNAEETKAVAA